MRHRMLKDGVSRGLGGGSTQAVEVQALMTGEGPDESRDGRR